MEGSGFGHIAIRTAKYCLAYFHKAKGQAETTEQGHVLTRLLNAL